MVTQFLVNKLNKLYTHKKIEFTRNQHSEKVIRAQHEVALTILLLKLSIKEQIVKQQEDIVQITLL